MKEAAHLAGHLEYSFTVAMKRCGLEAPEITHPSGRMEEEPDRCSETRPTLFSGASLSDCMAASSCVSLGAKHLLNKVGTGIRNQDLRLVGQAWAHN